MDDLNLDPRDIPTMNIISSHSISSKVTRCLFALLPASTPSNVTSPVVVGLRAKSTVALKAITIAEIVKRRLGDLGEQWYQYSQLSSSLEEVHPGNGNTAVEEKHDRGPVGAEETQDEDDPFVKVEEKETKRIRATPVLTIYISRTPLPAFAKLYGYGLRL